MKLTLFFIFILFPIFHLIHAQQRVSGQIYDETGKTLSGIKIYNVTSGIVVTSGEQGSFNITAKAGEELRFISSHFERAFRVISPEDFGRNLTIMLASRVREIEKVELGFKPTGDLTTDMSRLPKDKKKERMNEHLDKSIALGEDKTITKPVARIPEAFDYTGIVKGGFMMGGIRDKTDKYHLMDWIKKTLGEAYFSSMGIPRVHIDRFIEVALVGFDTSKMLKYGVYTDQDLTNIKVQMEKKKDNFINELPKTNDAK